MNTCLKRFVDKSSFCYYTLHLMAGTVQFKRAIYTLTL